MKGSDLDLLNRALALVQPDQEELRSVLSELRTRLVCPYGLRKFIHAWTQGRLARTNGIPREDCPFVEKTEKTTFTTARRKAWLRGWDGLDKGFATKGLQRAKLNDLIRMQRRGATG